MTSKRLFVCFIVLETGAGQMAQQLGEHTPLVEDPRSVSSTSSSSLQSLTSLVQGGADAPDPQGHLHSSAYNTLTGMYTYIHIQMHT